MYRMTVRQVRQYLCEINYPRMKNWPEDKAWISPDDRDCQPLLIEPLAVFFISIGINQDFSKKVCRLLTGAVRKKGSPNNDFEAVHTRNCTMSHKTRTKCHKLAKNQATKQQKLWQPRSWSFSTISAIIICVRWRIQRQKHSSAMSSGVGDKSSEGCNGYCIANEQRVSAWQSLSKTE